MITASLACKEALVYFHGLRGELKNIQVKPPCVKIGASDGNVCVGVCLDPKQDLNLSVEDFCAKVIYPAIDELKAALLPGAILSDGYEKLPTAAAVIGCANERYRGVAMRCVIAELPVAETDDPRIWRSYSRRYCAQQDNFVWADYGVCIRFDVSLTSDTVTAPVPVAA